MKKIIVHVILVFLYLISYFGDPTLIKNDLILQDDFKDVISTALSFLKNRQKRDGSFIYDFQPFKGRILHTDNIVRQAGTFFGLATTWNGENKGQKETIDKAISFFKTNSFPFTVHEKQFRIISKNHEGFTGAICLFLAGYFNLHYRFPKEYPIDSPIYKELLETLDYYFHPMDGVPDYINLKENYLEKIGRPAEIYATAQYFMVLSIYQLAFKRQNFHPSVVDILRLYESKVADQELMLAYHWLMLALTQLYDIQDPDWTPFIIQMIEGLQTRYEKEYPLEKVMKNYCAKAEGYSYYLRYKQKRQELDRQQLYTLGKHLRHLKNFQITAETYLSEKKEDEISYLPVLQPDKAIGGFWHKEKDIHHLRIDYTQHCLSAYSSYQEVKDKVYPDMEAYEAIQITIWEEEIERKARETIDQKKMQRILLKTILK